MSLQEPLLFKPPKPSYPLAIIIIGSLPYSLAAISLLSITKDASIPDISENGLTVQYFITNYTCFTWHGLAMFS